MIYIGIIKMKTKTSLTNKALFYSAASTTFVAGVLHLAIVPSVIGFSAIIGVFFLVVGTAQLFWVIPIVKRWGKRWYDGGIVGTVMLIAIWLITRVPENRIINGALPVNDLGIVIEALQIVFVLVCGIIISRDRTEGEVNEKHPLN